ncbi:MAG: TolC family protein [Gemmataceae bacterium]|nr:TolC family protein [Gemmataceae bacterium]
MSFLPSKWFAGTLALLLVSGCSFPVREQADHLLVELAARPLDLSPMPLADQTLTPGAPAPQPPAVEGQPPKPGSRLSERLRIPPELPGAQAPPIELPPAKAPRAEKEAAMNRLFPPLPPLDPDPPQLPGPEGHPLTLADLQRLALAHSPVLRQAAADVEAARGAVQQAGLYPNPTVGYEADTAGTGGTAGYQGGYIEQQVKTAGKLKLAQAAAAMDLANAELALRRAQIDVMTQVRRGYFGVLVAQENIKVTRALARFTEEVYRIQVEQLKEGQAAAYEPFQLRVPAMQARGALVQARNRYSAAWKGLVAALGLLAMPPTELAGRVDSPLPLFDYDKVLAQILERHTDVLTAHNSLQRARYHLRLAQVTPIPDVDLRLMVQKDFTTPPFLMAHSVQVGIPFPVWDRNQGNIIQAQGQLLRASEEASRARNDLTARLAEAFQRYQDNLRLLDYYRLWILPDQVRAYRGVYERHQQEPEIVSFGDVVTAQQTLAATITTYVTTLGEAWTAVVEVANVLQTTDLFQVDTGQPVAPVPELPLCPWRMTKDE